jgi:hypothetical protein
MLLQLLITKVSELHAAYREEHVITKVSELHAAYREEHENGDGDGDIVDAIIGGDGVTSGLDAALRATDR